MNDRIERAEHGFEVVAFDRRSSRAAPAVLLLGLALVAGGCSGTPYENAERAEQGDVSERRNAVQWEVDTLLRVDVELEALIEQRGASRTPDASVQSLVGEVAELAQELAVTQGNGTAGTLERLSRLAGKIPVHASRLKRAIRADDTLGASEKAELSRRVDQVRIAARSLGISVDELQASLGLGSTARLGLAERASIQTFSGELSPESQWHILLEGHVDAVDVSYEDGELGLAIHDESVDPDVERDPARTILVAKPAAKVQVPDERFAFLGPIGADVWLLPQSQLEAEAAGILWPGIATAEVEPGVFLNDRLEVRIRNVTGPNGFSLFESPQDEFSPPHVIADSEDGLPDTVDMPVLTHRHVNWAFEAPGLYLVRVQARGRLSDVSGNPWVTSPSEWLKFVVLP